MSLHHKIPRPTVDRNILCCRWPTTIFRALCSRSSAPPYKAEGIHHGEPTRQVWRWWEVSSVEPCSCDLSERTVFAKMHVQWFFLSFSLERQTAVPFKLIQGEKYQTAFSSMAIHQGEQYIVDLGIEPDRPSTTTWRLRQAFDNSWCMIWLVSFGPLAIWRKSNKSPSGKNLSRLELGQYPGCLQPS